MLKLLVLGEKPAINQSEKIIKNVNQMSDEQNQDQAIDRLYRILLDGKNTNGIQQKGNQKTPVHEITAWGKILQIEDEADIFKGIFAVEKLSHDVVTMIGAHPKLDPNIYLEHFNKNIPKLFRPFNPRAGWEQRRSLITDAVLKELQICSHQYPDGSWSVVPDEEEIKKLLLDISELSSRLAFTDIDHQLKQVIMEHLELARSAIILYRVQGIEAVQLAVDAATGLVLRRKDEISEALEKSDEESKKWWSDWSDWILKADKAINLGNKSIDFFGKLFPNTPGAGG